MRKTLSPSIHRRTTALQRMQSKMQKKLTSHYRQCPLEGDRSATCGLLTMSIFWEAVKKNCNNSLKFYRK